MSEYNLKNGCYLLAKLLNGSETMFQTIYWQLTTILSAMLLVAIAFYLFLLRREIKYKVLMEWKTSIKEELKSRLNEIVSYILSILVIIYFAFVFNLFYFAIFYFVILILIIAIILHPKKYAICEEGVFVFGILRKWNEFSYYKVKGNKIHLIRKYLFSISIENKEGVEKIVIGFLKEKG